MSRETRTFIKDTIRLRPHNILCVRFAALSLPERGEKFNQVEHELRETLQSGTNLLIEVIEGTDDLCQVCPLCQDARCQSPEGDEDEVRKFDAIILKGLGISYGDKMTVEELRALMDEKAPLAFCQTRCRLKEGCGVVQLAKR